MNQKYKDMFIGMEVQELCYNQKQEEWIIWLTDLDNKGASLALHVHSGDLFFSYADPDTPKRVTGWMGLSEKIHNETKE